MLLVSVLVYCLLAYFWPTQANALPPETPLDSPAFGVWLPEGVGLPKPPPKPKYKLVGDCQCVVWAKAQVGFTKSIGNARNWPDLTKIPAVGSVVITRESPLGHAGIVTGIENGDLIISEKNFVPCTVTHGRRLPVDSPLIIGYWIKGL